VNICVVSNQVKKTISGVGLHTYNLVGSLVKDGHRVWVVAPEEQRPAGDLPYDFLGVPKPLFNGSQARWFGLSWNYRPVVAGLLNRQPIDLVHFTDARESFFYREKAPAVGNMNDTYSAELQPLGYYRKYYSDWLVRWLYYSAVHLAEGVCLRRLDAVIANSHFTAGVIGTQYHIRPEKLFACYKSIAPERYRPALALRQQQGAHAPHILFVGTNMQRKGLPVLIHAAPTILERFPSAEFWVVGEDKVIPQMQALCESEDVRPSFHFMGWKSQDELVSIYGQSDIFVMPSLTEALGMVFLEAMASGVAVVGTAVGGIPEIIQNGQNGLTIAPNEPRELAGAVLRLLEDRPLAERVRASGLETAQKFDVSHMMEGTYRIYQQVCARR
jgi:glycosyltransferase involved in cell wall biosynthesis